MRIHLARASLTRPPPPRGSTGTVLLLPLASGSFSLLLLFTVLPGLIAWREVALHSFRGRAAGAHSQDDSGGSGHNVPTGVNTGF